LLGKEKVDLTEVASYFPSFLWVLRDFTLALEDETTGKEITARQYLENALREMYIQLLLYLFPTRA
jgi:hypothetical protein